MNDTTRLAPEPEVARFVRQVRGHLGDLSEEEREELVGGLEADLCDLVADGGALDGLDPAAYAGELCTAAGLGSGRRARSRGRGSYRPPTADELTGRLDAARAAWDEVMARHRWSVAGWDLARTLRPAWWVLRAWVAVEALDLLFGPPEYATVVPSLGAPLVGPVFLLAATVLSALLGVRRLHRDRSAALLPERLGLLALNGLAVVMLLVVTGSFPGSYDSHALRNGEYLARSPSAAPGGSGLRSGSHYVRNVFAYDRSGRPLTGVQLFDAHGRALAVSTSPDLGSYLGAGGPLKTTYPWFNGDQPLFNVFPLPVREQGFRLRTRSAWSSERPPALPTLPKAPLAVAPPVVLPDSGATTGSSPVPSARPTSGPAARATSEPSGKPTGKASDSEKDGRR